MGSSRHERCGHPSFFRPTEPHFLKIILDHVIDTKKLRIPMKFVKENSGSLTSKAILKAPSDLVWEVDLLKHNREVWLDKGWQGFSDFHSLSNGDFLLFKYLGNSEFSVVIIDRSATEIRYPITNTIEVRHNHDKESEMLTKKNIQDDISVEFLDDCSLDGGQDEKLSSSPSQSMPQKRGRSYSTENKVGRKGISGFSLPHLEGNARGFRLKNPFFIRAMKSCHIQARGALKIPLWFTRKFITKRTAHVMLSLLDGRSWKVKLDYTVFKGEKRVKLLDGWFAFVRDNCLGVGDTCAFQLIKGPEFALKVSISWQAEGSSHPPSRLDSAAETGDEAMPNREHSSNTVTRRAQPLRHSEKCDALRKACSAFTSKNPFFMIALQPSYAEGNILCVPRKFFDKHAKPGSPAMLEVGDRWWPVKLYGNNSRRQFCFTTGWHEFARDNSLKVGDVCVFELIDRDITLLKVFISRFSCF